MSAVTDLRGGLNRQEGKRDLLTEQRKELRLSYATHRTRLQHIQQARILLQSVARETQEQLRYHIEEIVTLALDAVFPNPYQLQVDFVERRGKTECDLWFVRQGEEPINPLDASGGGAVDVAAFALRVALYCLTRPKLRAVMIMDEPFKHLSANLHERGMAMIREISLRLGVQFIVVTHSAAFAEGADRVIKIQQRKGISSAQTARMVPS